MLSKIKNNVTNNLKKIRQLNSFLESINSDNFFFDHKFFDYVIYNKKKLIKNETISIVMTTNNRIRQTLVTLNTINESKIKTIQVIIVDDSDIGFLPHEILHNFNFQIDYLKIIRKDWINPCINYNLGFKLVKGEIIILQNAEVCHIGDIVSYVQQKITPGIYLSFDVSSLRNMMENEIFYNLNFDHENIIKYINENSLSWKNHSVFRNKNYHFLVAFHQQHLLKLGGFDLDFAFGSCADDDEFIFRIHKIEKLKIVNVKNETTKLMGMHQFHEFYQNNRLHLDNFSRDYNRALLKCKIKYFKLKNKWIFLYKERNITNIKNFIGMI